MAGTITRSLREGRQMTYYVIGGDGQRYGPEDSAVLAQWAREGRLVGSSVLIEADSGRRLTAAQIPELGRELGSGTVKVVVEPGVGVAQALPPYMAFGQVEGVRPT